MVVSPLFLPSDVPGGEIDVPRIFTVPYVDQIHFWDFEDPVHQPSGGANLHVHWGMPGGVGQRLHNARGLHRTPLLPRDTPSVFVVVSFEERAVDG